MVAMQLSPAAYGTQPHLRHLDLEVTPVLSFTNLVKRHPCCRAQDLFPPSVGESSASTQGTQGLPQ